MTMLSQRVKGISPSATMAISTKAKEMKRQGIDVIAFGVGEPDFDTPEQIKAAGIQAIAEGFTKYTPPAGTPELREAICAKHWRDYGLEYHPNEIVVSVGAKYALYAAFQALCDPGDEVLLPAPYWVSYSEQIKLAGAVPVVVETREEDGFNLDPARVAEKITPRTKMIVLNSPNNPTGAVYSPDILREIGFLAIKHDFFIISDECYEMMVYDDAQHFCVAALEPEFKRQTLLVNAVSKAYAMTGWRIGWVACQEPIARAINALQGHSATAGSMNQRAARAALTGPQETIREMVAEFDQRRRYMFERISAWPGVTCARPQGAFYMFPNFASYKGRSFQGQEIRDIDYLGTLMLDQAHVAVVPGSGFGAPDYIRFSYANSMANIKAGLDRVEAFLRHLD
jgi:aspartate aminotransferase